MGYKRQAKVYTLVFDDPEFEGLEIRVKSMSIGRLREFLTLRGTLTDDETTTLESALDMFAGSLQTWNLEDDDDRPVPANREGIDSQDVDFVMSIISAWVSTLIGVPDADPLGGPSPDGEPSLVASIPMVPLSQSQAS